MDTAITQFLKVLDQFKTRLERVKSFHDPEKSAYQYLLDQANDFSGTDFEEYANELFAMLAVENAERLLAKMAKILNAYPDDVRPECIEACGLIVEPKSVQYTIEWIKKAEKALSVLRNFDLRIKIQAHLDPYTSQDVADGSLVGKARALLNDPVTNSWYSRAKSLLDKLDDIKAREIAKKEAFQLLRRLEQELGEPAIANDNREAFFHARELLKSFKPLRSWVVPAEKSLLAVRLEKAQIFAKKTLAFAEKKLLSSGESVPEAVGVLRDLLKVSVDVRDSDWVARVESAVKVVKSFKPAKRPAPVIAAVESVENVVVQAPANDASDPDLEERKLKLKKVWEEGEPVPAMEAEVGPADRQVKNGDRRVRREPGQRKKK